MKVIWKQEKERYQKTCVYLDIDQIINHLKEFMTKRMEVIKANPHLSHIQVVTGAPTINIPNITSEEKTLIQQKIKKIKEFITSIFGPNLKKESEDIYKWINIINDSLSQKIYLKRSLEHKLNKLKLRGIISEAKIKKQASLIEEIEDLKKEEEVLRAFYDTQYH